MLDNIFIRLNYETVRSSLMNCVEFGISQNPVVDKIILAGDIIESFTEFVNQHSTYDFGEIHISLLTGSKSLDTTDVCISGFATDNRPRSVVRWRDFLHKTLMYLWKSFWPMYLKKRRDSLHEDAKYLGITYRQIVDAEKWIQAVTFHSWIRSLCVGDASNSPSYKDFEAIQWHDFHKISQEGRHSWLAHTQSIGFKWADTDSKMRRGTFYRHINKQIYTIRLMMCKEKPSHSDRVTAVNILDEAMRLLNVDQYNIKDFMAKLRDQKLMQVQYEKLATSSWFTQSQQQADKVRSPQQMIVSGTSPAVNWFTF